MEKIHNLVQMVNDNVDNATRITADAMISNPKLLSFKLMKLDLEHSCRSRCEIERKEILRGGCPNQLSPLNVIANSSEQLQVQAAQKAKIPAPNPSFEPKGYNPAIHNNNVEA